MIKQPTRRVLTPQLVVQASSSLFSLDKKRMPLLLAKF
jgi:hypothetical protein